MSELKLGCHVGMNTKEMFLGSVKEAHRLGANTFMIYTGAPQNTRRKDLSELHIEDGLAAMKEFGITELVVHAPYIINMGNSVKKETIELAANFLSLELSRAQALKAACLVLHPGTHVGEGEDKGLKQVIKGLNQVLTPETQVNIALETMAGKGSELGKTFEELARIYDGVVYSDKLRVCFDTCHTFDAGYDIKEHFDEVIEKFDRLIGKKQISVFHINDSKNNLGDGKDRHENIGFGKIGFEALNYIVHHKDFGDIPKILETPYMIDPDKSNLSYTPYKHEIQMLKDGIFKDRLADEILKDAKGI